MLRSKLFLTSSALLVSALVANGCSNVADDCNQTSTCTSSGGSPSGGTSAGTSSSKSGSSGSAVGGAEGGESGTTNGGSSSGSGGTIVGSGGAGAGGEAGMPVVLPCDGACVAPKAVCDEQANACVECLEEADCAAGAKKKCDTDKKTCVDCLAPADCSDAKTARCNLGACVKCTSNNDCSHLAGTGVCDTVAGECVQCTGKDYDACGVDAGTPLVCDSKARTCSNKKKASAGLCQSCVTDAQCKAGQVCAEEKFGSPAQSVGFFCFWKKGDTGNGAPATCLPDGDPYAKTLTNQTSIDGATTDLCGLRASTCTARNQFSSKDCGTSNAADDNKCGFAPGKDSKCTQADVGVFRCTMTCGSDDDCPAGFPCDTGVTPAVCKL